MTSWYSNLLTKTSSQISSLRATLLPSEADGDTDDDTHVCRVLRNYYADKGRPLPPWLPPDPKAPVAPAAQPLYAQQSQVGSRYGAGALAPQQQQQQQPGGLSSLWDSGPAQQQPQSLRAGSRTSQSRGGRDDVMARPLPSQRAGSYQNAGPAPGTPQPGPGASAQDRLRQRLRGGPSSRTSSPAQAGPGPYQPPPPAAISSWSGGGGGGGDDYHGGGPGPGSARWGGGAPGPGPGTGPGPGPGARQGLPAGPRRQGLPPGGPRGYR